MNEWETACERLRRLRQVREEIITGKAVSEVAFGEVVEVTAEQGKELVSTGNFEPVKAGKQEG